MTRNTELTTERVKELLGTYEADGFGQVQADAARRLKDNGIHLARLCLSLAAQLQQEREARERLEKALVNVHAMATRQIHRTEVGKKLITDDWRHVKRFCEESGVKPSFFRAALAQPAEVSQ